MTKFPFLQTEWCTPNTYDTNFREVPSTPGVYMLVWVDLRLSAKSKIPEQEILYIGSAKNLLQRYNGHEILRVLRKTHGYIQFHFQECENYYQREIELIKKFTPIFNTQHNG